MVKLSVKNIPYENFDLEIEDESGKISKYTFKIRYSNLDMIEQFQKLENLKNEKLEVQIKAYRDLYDLMVLGSSMKKEDFFKLNVETVLPIMAEMVKVSTSKTASLTEEKKSN